MTAGWKWTDDYTAFEHDLKFSATWPESPKEQH